MPDPILQVEGLFLLPCVPLLLPCYSPYLWKEGLFCTPAVTLVSFTFITQDICLFMPIGSLLYGYSSLFILGSFCLLCVYCVILPRDNACPWHTTTPPLPATYALRCLVYSPLLPFCWMVITTLLTTVPAGNLPCMVVHAPVVWFVCGQ